MIIDFPKMGKVYSYIRFSDIKQKEGNSVERQELYAEKWAKDHGMVLDDSYKMLDEGLSAYHQRHVKTGAFGAFLKSIEDGLIEPGSVLIVECLDRISRAEPMLAQAQLSQIVNAGVSVVTAADNKIYSREGLKQNPMDLIYSVIIMIRAHEESERKSERVKDAITKRCEQWITGTYRGIIRNGTDPDWVHWNGKQWEIVEAEAMRMRRIVELYVAGYGGMKILDMLEEEGFRRPPIASNIYRWFTKQHHLLIGTRVMTVRGQDYRLEGYYPPLIDNETYHQLLSMTRTRKRGTESGIPGIMNGNGLLRCGYCGGPMGLQVIVRKRALAEITDGHRRLRCPTHRCPTGTTGAVPFERALVEWCSDQMNLNSLAGRDDRERIRSHIAEGRRSMTEFDKQINRLVTALAESDDPPAAVTKKLREIETMKLNLAHQIQALEAQLLRKNNVPTLEASALWKGLAKAAIEDLDYDARIRLRQLTYDTFAKIVIYRYGLDPSIRTPHDRAVISDMLLVSKSGVTRHLRINHKGKVIAIVDELRSAS